MLVIDVGGGTADFTVIRLSPARHDLADRPDDVLASDGIHIAGTDFDAKLSLAWVMPTLGYGTIGPKGKPVPSLVYFDLSTWHRINLLYTPKFHGRAARAAGVLRRSGPVPPARARDRQAPRARAPRPHRAGEDRAVGRGQRTVIRLDAGRAGPRGGRARAPSSSTLLADQLARLVQVGTCDGRRRGSRAGARSRPLYFTGGSSGMRALRQAFEATFPASRVVVGDLFGSVVSGLGLDAARRFR